MANLDTEKELEYLAEKAQELVDEHWEWHLSFNKDRRPEDKSKLNLYLRKRGEVFDLFWTRFWFVRLPDKEGSVTSRRYISKGKGDKYPNRHLLRHAQEAEVEPLLAFEERAAEIRKVARYIREIKTLERKVMKVSLMQERNHE